jgi:hypothetical protein
METDTNKKKYSIDKYRKRGHFLQRTGCTYDHFGFCRHFCHFQEAGIRICIGIGSRAIVNQQARAGLPHNTV